jgi:hypothetical protein
MTGRASTLRAWTPCCGSSPSAASARSDAT